MKKRSETLITVVVTAVVAGAVAAAVSLTVSAVNDATPTLPDSSVNARGGRAPAVSSGHPPVKSPLTAYYFITDRASDESVARVDESKSAARSEGGGESDFAVRVIAPFESDYRNPSWASMTEESLVDQFNAFMTSKDLHNVSLDMVECRAHTCRVDLYFETSDVAEKLQDNLFGQEVFRLAGCWVTTAGALVDDAMSDATQSLYFVCPKV